MINAFFSGEKSSRAYEALLIALTREVLDADLAGIEASAPSRRPMSAVKAEEEALVRERLDAAREQAGRFREALEDARSRLEADGCTTYSSTDPQESAIADVLIQYLVRSGYAEVETHEHAPGTYSYRVKVDWERLRRLAEREGHHLPW